MSSGVGFEVSEVAAGRLEYGILGPLEVRRDGVRLELGPHKQRAVLALLLLNANRVVPTDRLIDELWGDAPPETVRAALQVYVAGLRKALGNGQGTLRTQAPGYVLEVDPGTVDRDRFDALRAEARASSDVAVRSSLLHEALGLWRDAPLTEFDGERFAEVAAAQLEDVRLGALEERIDADLELGRHTDVISELDALVAAHPYRERLRAQQMIALYRSGRQADALAAYRAAREAFASGLGLEPGAELKALERAVLEQDPQLDAPAAPPEESALPRSKRWLAVLAAAAAIVALAVAGILVLDREAAAIVAPPNSVAIIDADTRRVVGTVPVGARPGSLAAGRDVVWVANQLDRSLTRIDAAERRFDRHIPLDATPNGVAVGFDAVWVVHGRLGQLSRVDPAFNRAETVPIGSRSDSIQFPLGAVTTGPGSLWVVFGDASLVRVEPRSPRESRSAYAGSGPVAVVAAYGSVWVANAGSGNVQRFSPLTFETGPLVTIPVGGSPSGLAAGDGSIWVSNAGDDTVDRIDSTTTSTASRTIDVGDGPTGIAYGAGAVWVANRADGSISRIDPATNDVTDVIPVGGAPSGVAVWDDEVWVTVQAP